MTTAVEPRLTRNWSNPDAVGLDGYVAAGGYAGLRTAVAMADADIVEVVKASGLRGRGGAGFPTGMKWGFVPRDTGKPTYVVVNFDESEPGTCNNRELVEREPHRLLEGTAIAALAIGCETAFIYVRGEYLWQSIVLERAIAEAYAGGYLGADVAGSEQARRRRAAPRRRRLHLRRGDRAVELARGAPRPAAPAPAVPRGRGPVREPDGDQQRRDADERARHPRARRGLVPRGRHREVAGHEDDHDQRQGRAARQLRDRARHAVPRGARGARRRDARRRHAEGLDPRRFLDADADRRPRRHRGWTTSRSRPRARCSAPPRSW